MNHHTSMPPRSSSRTSTRSSKSTKRRKIRWGRVIFILVSLVIISLASYAGYLYYVGKQNLHKIADQDPTAPPIPNEQKANVKPVSMVLLGLDYRKELGSMNTDVIMVAAFNPVTKTATVVSFARASER